MTPSAPCQPSLDDFCAEEQAELAELLDRYLEHREAGAAPAISEWLKDRPEMETALRGYIEQLNQIDGHLESPVEGLGQHRIGKVTNDREKWPEQPVRSFGSQTQLGDYRLLAEIGRGGMGIVYRAHQISLGRDVAIKTLPFASVLDPKQIKRFQNEAQAAGQLHHPNIVPVYAVGCERGVHYYSMQLIEGLSLEQVITDLRAGGSGDDVRHQTTLFQPIESDKSRIDRESKPTLVESSRSTETKLDQQSTVHETIRKRSHIESIVGLVIQAADALHYAHQCGVIHRDIKPSNLMIDGRGNLWITDFGLARCQQTTPMSVTGDLMGTLRYMSPEQASGRVHAVDHRTDTYALGITLYELLTLQFAFDASNRVELITLINQTSPVSARRINPSVPADLETIICKAISHEANDRYDSADDFAEDLKRFRRGEPPLAKRPTYLNRTVKWISRHQYLFLSTAATLLVIIGGLLMSMLAIAHQKRLTVKANERAQHHLTQTNRVVQNFGTLVLDRLDDVEGGDVVRQDLLGELKNYYLDFIKYANDRDDFPSQVPDAHMQLAGILFQSQELSSAREHYDHAIRVLESMPDDSNETPKTTATRYRQLASAYGKVATLQASRVGPGDWRTSIDKAIDLQREAEQLSTPPLQCIELSALMISQGDLLINSGDEQSARESLESAIVILDEKIGAAIDRSLDSVRLRELHSICYNNLASILQKTDPKRADALIGRAIHSAEELVAQEPLAARHQVHLARVFANSGSLAMQCGDVSKAEKNFNQAIKQWNELSRQSQTHSLHVSELAANLNSLGQLFLTEHRFAEAELHFLDAVQTLEALDGTSQASSSVLSDLASVQNNLGLCCEKDGRFTAAQTWYMRSIETQNLALSKEPSNPKYLDRLVLHQRNLHRTQSGVIVPATSVD